MDNKNIDVKFDVIINRYQQKLMFEQHNNVILEAQIIELQEKMKELENENNELRKRIEDCKA